jgi:hypothetical protein
MDADLRRHDEKALSGGYFHGKGAVMRFSASIIGNAFACVVIIVLLAFAFSIANFLGYLGLIVLGLIVAMVCSRAELDEDNPFVRSRADFDARRAAEKIYGQDPAAPERFTAADAEHRVFKVPLRFVRWCGIALAAIGAAGFAWEQWS